MGENQAVALKHKSTFQWNLTKGRDFDHYRSTLFQAKRNLKSGGADTYMLTEQQQKEKALANESIGD